MVNTNVINDIDLRTDEAELDVLFSICESYNKILSIVTLSPDTEIIQESFSLFMEAKDDTNEKKSLKDYVVSVISKICEAFKSIIVKIIDIINKKFFKKRESFNAVINCLMFLDAFKHVTISSVVQETGLCNIEFDGVYAEFNNDDIGEEDIVQERWTPADEMRYRKAERNITQAKAGLPPEQLKKGLENFYRVEIRHKVLSKKEITDIVKCVLMTARPEVVDELKEQVTKFEFNDTLKALSEEAQGYKKFIVETVDKKNQQKWEEICTTRATQCETPEQANMELNAIATLAENFGQSVSNLTKQRVTGSKVAVMDTLTTRADKAIYRGFLDLADIIMSTIKQIPAVLSVLTQDIKLMDIKNVKQNAKQLKSNFDTSLTSTGAELRKGYEEFQKRYHHDKDLLNEMNEKATKTISVLKFCGDGIGEETIIANQDFINSDVYRPENIKGGGDVARILGKMAFGGPCTFVMKIFGILLPGYVAWATATMNGFDAKQAFGAAGAAVGATALSKVSSITVKSVFKTLTGTAIRGYAVRKLTGDMDAQTPTMIHDEKVKQEKQQEKEQKRQQPQERFADRVIDTLKNTRENINNVNDTGGVR